MANKKTETKEESPVVELSNFAVGTYLDPTSNNWFVAILKFDPVSGMAKIVQRTVAGNSEDFAHEQFKIEAVSLGLV